MTGTPAPKTLSRHSSRESARASAGRLATRYGQRFAVVTDTMGLPTFSHPFAVITHDGYHNPYAR